MERQSRTTRLVTIALLITMEVILTRLCSLFMPTAVRIGFGFLPVAMVAILYGPIWAGAAYAIGDIIGMLLFPVGKFFPGFTLTAFLTGIVYGLVLYGHPVTHKRALLASAIVVLCFNLVLDTYWLYLLYDQAVVAMLPLRVLKCVIAIPLQTFLIPLVWNRCITKLPPIRPAVK